jgi:hypothetical protein
MCQGNKCIEHGNCAEGENACRFYKRGLGRAEICSRCTSLTCYFELADFTGANI